MRSVFLFLPWLLLTACGSVPALPENSSFLVPPVPDYSEPDNWAASPFEQDEADRTPGTEFTDQQATATADVFYLHPTIYRKAVKGNDLWNANLADAKLNKSVEYTTSKAARLVSERWILLITTCLPRSITTSKPGTMAGPLL